MDIKIFVSYCHQDETHRYELAKHMAPLLREKGVEAWYDGDIEPGQKITPEIRRQLKQTDIFLALGSHHYLHSDYCYRREYRFMLRTAKQGRPRIVVALVGICDWPSTEMAKSKMLPDDAKSVEEHGHRNRAYLEIVRGLRRVVRAVKQEKGKEAAEIERKAIEKAKAAKSRRQVAASSKSPAAAQRTKAPNGLVHVPTQTKASTTSIKLRDVVKSTTVRRRPKTSRPPSPV